MRREDTWLNFGAHVYGGDGTATDRLLRGLGVTALPLPGKLAALAYAGRVVTQPGRDLPVPAAAAGALARSADPRRPAPPLRRRALRSRRSPSVPASPPAERQARVVSFMDDESFSEHIGPLPPDVDAMFRCTLTRSSGEPEELAAGYGVGYFHLVWDRSAGLSRGVIGGPSTIIERLAGMVPEVRTGSRVTLVEQTGDGVRVVGGGRRRDARDHGLPPPSWPCRRPSPPRWRRACPARPRRRCARSTTGSTPSAPSS